MIDLKDRLLGGLYGVLIGDAVGAPYEFKRPEHVPPFEQIDMTPPEGYARAWSSHPTGIWTDDGSQTLNLLEMYTELQPDEMLMNKWMIKLCDWDRGHLWYDNDSFDSGMQTMSAIQMLKQTGDPWTCAPHDVSRNGNGSLMRCLPTILWQFNKASMQQLFTEVTTISHLTHPHVRSKICCMLYTLMANELLKGAPYDEAYILAARDIGNFGFDTGEIAVVMVEGQNAEVKGTGYVVDALWTADYSIHTTASFEECIRRAISFGRDTDTTAAIAGGLAGIMYGYSGIPQRWIDELKGKDLVEPLAKKLLERHGLE